MDDFDDSEGTHLKWATRSEYPVSYAVRNHLIRFRGTFYRQRYPVFFHRVERITKRKLSLSERDDIVSACGELIQSKEYLETAEEFRQQLKSEAEHEKSQISDLQGTNALAGQLLRHFESLAITLPLVRRPIMEEFRSRLYESLDIECSTAPIVEVLRGIVKTSEDVIERHKPKTKPGPLPDAALRKCIIRLAQVFGENAATAGWSHTEDRRVSSFIDFVHEILFALPENAMIGRNGPYLAASIEAHVAAALADVKKGVTT